MRYIEPNDGVIRRIAESLIETSTAQLTCDQCGAICEDLPEEYSVYVDWCDACQQSTACDIYDLAQAYLDNY